MIGTRTSPSTCGRVAGPAMARAQRPTTIMPVQDIRLRPMTAAEWDIWRTRIIPAYAAEHVRAGDWNAEQAESRAARETDNLLPAGVETPGMLLLSAEKPDGSLLGMVWLAIHRPRPGAAWIYNIEVLPEHRGKGYGRALLQAAEQHSVQHGLGEVGLNVFGANAVARSLYESSGYQVTAINMRKWLGGHAGAALGHVARCADRRERPGPARCPSGPGQVRRLTRLVSAGTRNGCTGTTSSAGRPWR
jgi:ribosomal protein S18 acetylase RimI-like enzyme